MSMLSLRPEAKGSEALRPTQAEAGCAVRLLIAWAGDNPDREGLIDTPARVDRSSRELFCGCGEGSRSHFALTFEGTGGYDGMIVLSDIRRVSCCEHHRLPVVGQAHVGYLPSERVVGISKPARVVAGFSRRLQIQEALTAQSADAIQDGLQPRGVGVVIEAEHSGMTLRGVGAAESRPTTSRLRGRMRDDPTTRDELLASVCRDQD